MCQIWNESGLEHVCLEFDWFRMCQFWNFPWCQKTTIFKKAENAFFPANQLTVLSAVLPSTQKVVLKHMVVLTLGPDWQQHENRKAFTCRYAFGSQLCPLRISRAGGLHQVGECSAEWKFQDQGHWADNAEGGEEWRRGICWEQWGECWDGHGCGC